MFTLLFFMLLYIYIYIYIYIWSYTIFDIIIVFVTDKCQIDIRWYVCTVLIMFILCALQNHSQAVHAGVELKDLLHR